MSENISANHKNKNQVFCTRVQKVNTLKLQTFPTSDGRMVNKTRGRIDVFGYKDLVGPIITIITVKNMVSNVDFSFYD